LCVKYIFRARKTHTSKAVNEIAFLEDS